MRHNVIIYGSEENYTTHAAFAKTPSLIKSNKTIMNNMPTNVSKKKIPVVKET